MNTNKEENWKTFFKTKLEDSGFYKRKDCGKHGDTDIEKYISNNKNDKTEINVGYLNDKLIWLHFVNPITIGFTEQQNREFFYMYDFTPEKMYGDPGLEYKENNVNAISHQLDFGLVGAEIQYFKNQQLIKSKIYIDEPNEYSTTINFEKKNLWNSVKSLFKNSEKEIITEKRIELNEIFSGLKNK